MLRKRDLQSTDRLTQEKCQVIGTTVCSGGKTPLILLLRSGNEWWVEQDEEEYLKASVGDESTVPPTTGWKFYNIVNSKYEEAPGLTCTIPATSPSCCLTVSLSGRAKELQGKCEGKYESTGMFSFGREVGVSSQTVLYITKNIFRCSNWKTLSTATSS